MSGPDPRTVRRSLSTVAFAGGVAAVVVVALTVPSPAQTSAPAARTPASISASVSASMTHPASPSVVPFVSLPAVGPTMLPYTPSPTAVPPKVAAAAQPCRTAALKVLPGRYSEMFGFSQELIVQDVSRHACRIAAQPVLVPMEKNGSVPPWPLLLARTTSRSVVIRAGGAVNLVVAQAAGCTTLRGVVTRLRIGLLTGESLVDAPVRIPLCQHRITEWPFGAGFDVDQPQTPDPVSRPTGLLAALDAPAALPRGTRVDLTLTIRNPTQKAIRLRPCPDYFVGYLTRKGRVDDAYELNCAAAPAVIGPGQQVAFDVPYQVPADAPVGPAEKFLVALVDQQGVFIAIANPATTILFT